MLQNKQIKNLVSVIIPTYNYDLDRLTRAIQSVYDQTYRPIEIVICDDGSTIPLVSQKDLILDSIKIKELIVNLIFTANDVNEGISAARNKAVSEAKGEWLVWLDDDDTLDSDCIRQLLKHSEGKTMVIGECDVNEGGAILRRKPKPYFEMAKQYFKTEQDPFLLNIISIQPQLVSRTTFDQMGGFSKEFPYAELTEFFLRYLVQFGLEGLDFIEGAAYNYDRTNIHSHTKDREILFENRLKCLKQYKDKLNFVSPNYEIIYQGRNFETKMQNYTMKKISISDLGEGVFISNVTELKGNHKINHYAVIGSKNNPKPNIIGENIEIGAFCILEDNIKIGDNVVIDHHCSIYRGVNIGDGSKILYGARIFANSVLGKNCIVGSDIPERMVLGDRVTFMGQVAHSYRDASLDWDTTDEPSPTVGDGSIIGVNSLILGDIKIGKNCYVAAGEVLKHDLPDDTVFIKGKMIPIKDTKGLIKTRY